MCGGVYCSLLTLLSELSPPASPSALDDPEYTSSVSTAWSSEATKRTGKPPVSRHLKLQPVEEKAVHQYWDCCCQHRCLWDTPLNTVIKAHVDYSNKTTQQKTQFLHTILSAFIDPDNPSKSVHLQVHGKPVCKQGFKFYYGITNYKFDRALHDQADNTNSISRLVGNQNATHITPRSIAIAWIGGYVQEHATEDSASKQIHIPSYVTQQCFYEMFSDYWRSTTHKPEAIPSERSFARIMEHHFTNVSFLRHIRIGRCSFCIDFEQRRKGAHTEVQKLSLKEATRNHNALHTGERASFMGRVETSHQHPDNILHLTVDCPARYHVPIRKPVNTKTGYCVPGEVSAVGWTNLSVDTCGFLFFLASMHKDPNLIVSVLWYAITDALTKATVRPALLWLQLDNCAHENKNHTIMAFLC